MAKLKFIHTGYKNDLGIFRFVGTEFDQVGFQIDNFEFAEDIPDTEDCMVNFEYTIVSGEDTLGDKKPEFLELLGVLVREIIEYAVEVK